MLMLEAVMLLASCGGREGNAKQSQNSDSKVTTGTEDTTGTQTFQSKRRLLCRKGNSGKESRAR